MRDVVLSYPAPKNWQDFELLTKDLAKFRLGGDFENYGRSGQNQSGIDLFGFDKDSKCIGIQCKQKGLSPSTKDETIMPISWSVIEKELVKVDNFTPKLDRYIVATTSFRNVHIQDFINTENASRRGSIKPKIELWTWEVFEEEINRHYELAYIYYEKILKKFHQYKKDAHILQLLKLSLERPAFRTPFHSENYCEDFIKAIADTQRTFSTGRLYDRDGNLLASAYPGSLLSKASDKKIIKSIESSLQDIRVFVTANLANGNIVQQEGFLHFKNDHSLMISEFLNNKRRRVIEQMNNVLAVHNIDIIEVRL